MAGALLLAHQGGWDEALFVLLPLLLFAGLLIVARRRVDQMDADAETTTDAPAREPSADGTRDPA